MAHTNTEEKALKITLIGSEGTGKSAFLAGLAVLGLDVMNPIYKLSFQNHGTAVYLNNLRESFILHNQWPTPTLVTQLLDFNLNFGKKNLNILTIDYGGELFREAFNQMKPEDIQAFSDHLRQSEVLLFLVDAEEVVATQNSGKKFALGEKLRANLTAVQESCKEFAKTNQDKFNEMELCIVLTKADRVPELEGFEQNPQIARDFGEKYFGKTITEKMDGLLKTENIRYFAVSSIGQGALDPNDLTRISGEIHPTGYEGLFGWVANRGKRRFNRWLIATMIFVIVCAGIAGSLCYSGKKTVDTLYELHVREAIAILNNQSLPVIDRLNHEDVQKVYQDKRVKTRCSEVFQERKEMLLQELRNSHESKTIIELGEKIKNEKERIGNALWETDLQNIINECVHQREEIDFQEVSVLYKNKSEQFDEKAATFLVNHPKTVHKSDVEEYIHRKKVDTVNSVKREVIAIPVTTQTIQAKIDKINWFLKMYGQEIEPVEKQQMESALKLANAFKTKHQYKVKIVSHGQFSSARKQKILIRVNNQDLIRTEDHKAPIVTLNRDLTFDWQYGEPVELVLLGYEGFGHWKYKEFAKVNLDGFDVIKIFSQSKIQLNSLRGEEHHGPDGFFILFEGSPYTEDDWKAFEAYFFPGDAWNQTTAKETK